MNEESDRYRVGLSDPMFTAASGTRFAYRYSFLVSLVSLVTLLHSFSPLTIPAGGRSEERGTSDERYTIASLTLRGASGGYTTE